MRRAKSRQHCRLEPLEGRALLSGVPLSISELAGGTELSIIGTSGPDQITVTQTSQGLVVTNTGGWTSGPYTKTYQKILINGEAGADSIIVDASVTTACEIWGGQGFDTLQGGSGNDTLYGGQGGDSLNGGAGDDTLVSIGQGCDTLTGGSGNDSFWMDATQDIATDISSAEIAAGDVHRITTFMNVTVGGVSVATPRAPIGQTLVDPTTTQSNIVYQNFSQDPLFSSNGPGPNDIYQGDLGDCYYLATLSSIAKTDPNAIRQSVVDLGDGTYAVRFMKNGVAEYFRVDGDLPVWSSGGLAYANTGAQNSIWAAIMEKAFAFFRTGTGTYASLNGGWMSEVYTDLGYGSSTIWSATNSTTLMQQIEADLNAGESVTFAVNNPELGAPLIGDHAYMVDSIVFGSNGQIVGLRLRNPWGVDGAGNDGSNDGYVTVTPTQALASMMGVTAAHV